MRGRSLLGCLLVFVYCNINPFVQGERLYEYHCSGCHMSNGEGMAKLYPPIVASDYLENHAEELACIIKFGMQDSIVVNGSEYDQPMAGNNQLSAAEIANVVNYIWYKWYGGNNVVTESKILVQLELCTN